RRPSFAVRIRGSRELGHPPLAGIPPESTGNASPIAIIPSERPGSFLLVRRHVGGLVTAFRAEFAGSAPLVAVAYERSRHLFHRLFCLLSDCFRHLQDLRRNTGISLGL